MVDNKGAINSNNLNITINEVPVETSIIHNGIMYGFVTSPYTGKVWLDRNLGATEVCTNFNDSRCYGDYYQWGRNFDGHEKSSSVITSILATNINNAGNNFIEDGSGDWTTVDVLGTIRSKQWRKTDGSAICPVGYRVPTLSEFNAELYDIGSAQVRSNYDAFLSFLKLPSAGYRSRGINGVRKYCILWTSSVDDSYPNNINSDNNGAGSGTSFRSDGITVRCLKN